jgi:hypothetical protein
MRSELEILIEILSDVLLEEHSTFENLTEYRRLLKQSLTNDYHSAIALEQFAKSNYPPQVWARVKAQLICRPHYRYGFT